jgi:DNA helicase-2/ATP-dependent DNA helicase PcrA
LTPVTSFIEGCAAWATLGREQSGYRLADLMDRWRSIHGERWQHADDITLVQLLTSFAELGHEQHNPYRSTP